MLWSTAAIKSATKAAENVVRLTNRAGTVVARFSSSLNPQYLVAPEREGLLRMNT